MCLIVVDGLPQQVVEAKLGSTIKQESSSGRLGPSGNVQVRNGKVIRSKEIWKKGIKALVSRKSFVPRRDGS